MAALENAKWERFCQEMLVDDNATQAYIRAGYSKNGAGQSAEKLLKNTEVAARLAELRAERAQRLVITQEKVVADLEDLRIRAAREGHFGPAVKATELLGKHIGMWPTKIDLSGTVALGDLIKRSMGKKAGG